MYRTLLLGLLTIVTFKLCAQAPTQPSSNLSVDSVFCEAVRLHWNPGNGLQRLVILQESTDSQFYPQDSVYYTDKVQSNGQAVFMSSTLDSALLIDGLSTSTTYRLSVFEFDQDLQYDRSGAFLLDSFTTDELSIESTTTELYVCEGNTLNYSGIASGPYGLPLVFTWHFSDGLVDTGNSVNHLHEYYGLHETFMEVTGRFCKKSIIINDTVAPLPVMDFELGDGMDSVQCIFQNHFDFRNRSYINPLNVPIAYATVKWDFDDGDTARQHHSNHSYQEVGLYMVRLEMSATYNGRIFCHNSDSMLLTVHESAVPKDISVSHPYLCVGQYLQIDYSGTLPSRWVFNGDTLDGMYHLMLQDSITSHSLSFALEKDSLCTDTVFNIEVVDERDFTWGEEIIKLNRDRKDWRVFGLPKAASYQWHNGRTSQEFRFNAEVYEPGEYWVHGKAIFNDECFVEDSMLVRVTTNPLSVPEFQLQGSVYPNPGHGKYTLSYSTPVSYGLYDLKGRLITRSSMSSYDHFIDISDQTPAVYLLKVNDGDKVYNVRLIKH